MKVGISENWGLNYCGKLQVLGTASSSYCQGSLCSLCSTGSGTDHRCDRLSYLSVLRPSLSFPAVNRKRWMTRAMLIHGAVLLQVAITVQSGDILPERTHPRHYLHIMQTRLEIRISLNPVWIAPLSFMYCRIKTLCCTDKLQGCCNLSHTGIFLP